MAGICNKCGSEVLVVLCPTCMRAARMEARAKRKVASKARSCQHCTWKFSRGVLTVPKRECAACIGSRTGVTVEVLGGGDSSI